MWIKILNILKNSAIYNGIGTSKSWIQNVAETRRNGRIVKVSGLDELRFHSAIVAIWNAIAVLKRFCRIRLKPKLHFESLD